MKFAKKGNIFKKELLKIKKYSNVEVRNISINGIKFSTSDSEVSNFLLKTRAKLKKILKNVETDKNFASYPNTGMYLINNNWINLVNSNERGLFNNYEIIMYDIKNCYPSMFLQLFDFGENLENVKKLLQSVKKSERLQLLGGLASQPEVFEYDKGNLTKNYIQKSEFAHFFWTCVHCLSDVNVKMVKKYKNDILLVFADAIFVKKNSDFAKINGSEFVIENVFNGKKIEVNYVKKDTFVLKNFRTFKKFGGGKILEIDKKEKNLLFQFQNSNSEIKDYCFSHLFTDFF